MDNHQFKKARRELGLTISDLGHILNTDPRTIRRWEADKNCATSRNPNPVASQVMRWMLNGFRPSEWPDNE